ncbi:MAG TPA: beta-N-acetylglucosaminidase domain-containing protein, partial [Gaiellaceae bacterium]
MARDVLITPCPQELELLDEPPVAAADLAVGAEPADGEAYTLTVSDGVATLTGAVHHAEQTLRQFGPLVPAVRIRDFPAYPVRGIIEGFYGRPWTHRERLDLLAFCARHKLNTFVYAPKDDPYHREGWRDLYPEPELARLAELVAEAGRRHVDFAWAVAPGLSIRHDSEDDFAALCAKAEQLWGIGVRSFQLLWDDIPDTSAAAQAELSNRFAAWLPEGARPLVVCPVEYHGTARSEYRDRFAERLDPQIVVYWTGPEVVSDAIGRSDAEAARDALGHELLLWDNYPVNDFEPSRLFLGPLVGRAPDLPVRGLIANGMQQAAPSKLAFATAADWAWNPAAYDPERSFALACRELGGAAAGALRVFAEASGHEPRAEPEALAAAARTLVRELDDPWFLQAAGPWLDAALDRSVPRYARIPALPEEHEALPERDDVLFVADKEAGAAARDSALPVV